MGPRVLAAAFAAALVATAVDVPATSARADDGPAAEILLDGKREEARVVVIDGDGSAPRPDDVLQVGGSSGFEILRGTTATLRFRRAGERLFEIAADGAETLVGLIVHGRGTEREPPEADPLALAPEAVARLRGVVVDDDWDHRLDALFARLDGARCFVSCEAREDGTLPPLPQGLRALRIEACDPEGPLDISALAVQTDLRSLDVASGRVADFGPLAGAQRLTRLAAPVHPENAATMPELRGLRAFATWMDAEVRDGAFLTRFPALETLDISHSRVRDLSAIGGLRDLREIDAEDARVESLPTTGLAALRKARLFGHRVPPAELAKFVAQHPAAEVEHDRRAAFVAGFEGADAVRVWHAEGRAGDVRRTLRHEGLGAAAVQALFACLQFDAREYRWPCLCDQVPEVEVEFLRGGEALGSVGVHDDALEGASIGGGGVLTDASAASLGAWLAERGFPARAERGERVAKSRAAARRPDEIAARRLGAVRVQDLRDAMSDTATARALRDLAPTAEERATICIRTWHDVVTECGEDATRRSAAGQVRSYLRDLEDAAAVAAVVDRMLASPADARVVAWYVARMHDARRRFPEAWFAKARLAAARVLLAIDAPAERALALHVLGTLDSPDAVPDLIRLLPSAGSGGLPDAPPTQFQSDAATLVARWCDVAMLPRLRAVVAASPGDDAARAGAVRRFDEVVASRR